MATKQVKSESRAIRYGAILTAAAFAVALIWFWGRQVPLFGPGSIGAVASLLAAVSAFAGFLISWRPHRAPSPRRPIRNALTAGALAFTHGAIALLLTVVLFYLVQDAFQGLTLDHWVSSVIVGVTAGIAGYAAYLAGVRMDTLRLSTTLAVFLASGVLASMISAPNPYWWQVHFSSLGGGGTGSAVAFNLTLLVSGLVIVGLADQVASDFALWQETKGTAKRVKVNSLRAAMAGMGLLLAGVGIFPYDTHLTAHNVCALGMGLLFMIMLASLPWLAPGFQRTFYIFSYAMLGAVLFCNWLFNGIHYLNLTAFELLQGGIIFAWLTVFVRQVAAGLADAGVNNSG